MDSTLNTINNTLIIGEDFEHEEALQDFEDFCRTAGAKMQGNNDTDIV